MVNPSFPYLGASPDGKVYNPTEKDLFGLLEIKNPYTWRNHTMEEACRDPNLCLHMVNGKPNLKKMTEGVIIVRFKDNLLLLGYHGVTSLSSCQGHTL